MDFEEVFNKERATRKFSTRKVDDELIKEIIKKLNNLPHCLIPNHGEHMQLLEALY